MALLARREVSHQHLFGWDFWRRHYVSSRVEMPCVTFFFCCLSIFFFFLYYTSLSISLFPLRLFEKKNTKLLCRFSVHLSSSFFSCAPPSYYILCLPVSRPVFRYTRSAFAVIEREREYIYVASRKMKKKRSVKNIYL